MTYKPVSVFIVTLNEAKYIADVLHSVRHFDEVIVVDSGSTDGTVAIAEKANAKVVYQPWLGYARQKAFAMSLCQNEWVLNVDGDEVLPESLSQQIQQLVNNGSADAYRLFFEDIFWGDAMSIHSAKRSIVRLFRKDAVSYPEDRMVHENVCLHHGMTEGSTEGLVMHYGYQDTHTMMAKQNQYSTLRAKEKCQLGKQPSILKLLLVFPLTLFKAYVLHKLFLSGVRGIVQAYIEAMYAFLKEAKLFEHHYQKKN